MSSTVRHQRHLRDQAQAGDPLALHELRKLARRMTSQLRVLGAPGRVRRAWRDLRRAAGPLRDHDVTGPLIDRALQAVGVPADARTALRARWAARRQDLTAQLHLPDLPPPWPLRRVKRRRWKRARRRAWRDVRAAVPSRDGRTGAEAWHAWRRTLKAYRAVLELRADAPAGLRTLLEILGQLQDAEVLRGAARHPDLAPYRPALQAFALRVRREARHAAWAAWQTLESD
ncbi:hypothetical protein Ddep01_01813 [Deinococcus depolymerans]|uniref:CHAD domain-containing protein n=1 Tax=Deinococcus depolymerans TaxID=392408 RepID=UPI0030A00220